MRYAAFAAISALALLAWAAPAPFEGERSAPGVRRPSWDRYQVVVDRNIFVRDRSVRRSYGPPSTQPDEPSTQPAPPGRLILTGTVVLGRERLAFVEDTQTGATSRVRPGQNAGACKVLNVGVDHIEIESSGRAQRVAIGDSFGEAHVSRGGGDGRYGGSSAGLPPPGPASGGPGSGTSGTPPSAGSGGSASEAAILERMRARRAQEVGR